MRIDLERALSDIATTAQSAAAPVPVDRLVSRMHRRRAVRGAATGTVAVGAVAAVAVGATQLGRGTTPAEPAVTAVTENPITSEYWATTPMECGAPAPTPTAASVYGVTLEASFSPHTLIAMTLPDQPQFLSNLQTTVTVTNDGGAAFDPYAPQLAQVVLVKDGAVALEAGGPLVSRTQRTIDLAPGASRTFSWISATSSCRPGPNLWPAPADPGSYEAYAIWRLVDETTGGQIELVSRPVAMTIGPGFDADLADAPTQVQAQAVLDQIRQAAPIGDFPLCAGAVYDHGSQPLTVSFDLTSGPYPGGVRVSGRTTVSPADDQVIADTSAPYLVIVKDGVVISFQPADDGSPMIPTDLAPGQSLPGTVRGSLTLCATADGVELPLPAGTYQAYAVVEALTYPSRPTDDRQPAETWAYSIVSKPVDITVD